MDISKFIDSNTGVVIISIIWGLGLATLFRKMCVDGRCQVVTIAGPDPNKVKSETYRYDNLGCYSFTPRVVDCSES